MKIEKLPSGSYRVRKTYKGKTYTKVFTYKPSQREALESLEALYMDKTINPHDYTVEQACGSYIDARDNVLSPSTKREYKGMTKRMTEEFLNLKVVDVTNHDVQKVINKYAKGHAPKTVKNLYCFIASVLGTFNPRLELSIKLPQKKKVKPYIPKDEDIRKVIDFYKGTEFEIALTLASFGLRRGEICALELSDLNGNLLTIDKALVKSDTNEWVVKLPKTEESTRVIYIPNALADKIRAQGFVFSKAPDTLYRRLKKAQKVLGLKPFSLHKMRHYFASKLSHMGVPEADIIAMGGWSSDFVMKTVYRHEMDMYHSNALEMLYDETHKAP